MSSGYLGSETQGTDDGWLHTGDIGEMDAEGWLLIRGRKKDVIVTAAGMNVFPEDVEDVLKQVPGVRDAAVVGPDEVYAVLLVDAGVDAADVVRQANRHLEEHQYIRRVSLWPGDELPYAEGTGKLKRHVVAEWVRSGGTAIVARAEHPLEGLLCEYAAGQAVQPDTRIDDLALSSLDRVDLMVRMGVSEASFREAQTVADLERAPSMAAVVHEEIPEWPRSFVARLIRDTSLPAWILPLARVFARLDVRGLEHLEGLQPPVIFAANHQSHMDSPVILSALPFCWRRRVAIAASKEFFAAHFHPEQFGFGTRFRCGLSYFLASLFFHMFPLPQKEAGAMEALRHAGRLVSDGWRILIFPEGERTDEGEIRQFFPGAGMMASRLGVPVVPIRLEGLDKILHKTWKMAKRGRASVRFGRPLRLEGDDYLALARQVRRAARAL